LHDSSSVKQEQNKAGMAKKKARQYFTLHITQHGIIGARQNTRAT
jgi:hypothetical protein